MAQACARVGRDPATVTLLAVTKSVSLDVVRAAIQLGLTELAENRVQEAEAKITDLPQARWQLVGHLQSNKAGKAVELFDCIQSVDSLELAQRIARLALDAGKAPYPIYVQVNVDNDEAKAGFSAHSLEASLPAIAALPGLELRGLMTVGRLAGRAEDARPTFGALRELSQRLRKRDARLGPELSMGMSDDFEIAIEELASVVRVGR
ncbi:MAG: YggS family pyridoxal phosphate-dependent enzyme, partial [Chloroflexota bacterium]|nr:YggS family pyridoxal phosphate-dependent enzyme [Chloroflexota bacterium]